MPIPDNRLASRFNGALLGCFVGDALGRPFEGASPQDAAVRRDLERRIASEGTWNYTDDTEMMIGVAESVIRCGGVVAEDLLRSMALGADPARGYGKGARITFEAFLRGTDTRRAAFVAWPEGSRGNGASVRVVPIACLYHADIATLEAAAEESAGTTHAHPIGRAGSILQALALAQALTVDLATRFDGEAFLLQLAERISLRPTVFAERLRAAARVVRNPPTAREAAALLGNGVSAEDSVPMALYVFASRFPSFEGVVVAAIDHGGDTDTIAAMSGALIGAALGMEAIPREWLARLENGRRGKDHVVRLGEQLAAAVMHANP